jgi:pimeloyl-ACP methyl ester carboxylesterase
MRKSAFALLMALGLAWPAHALAADNLKPCTRFSGERAMAEDSQPKDKILRSPNNWDAGNPDNWRCDATTMVVAVRDNGELRDIYRPGTFEPDGEFFPTLGVPHDTQYEKYIAPVIKSLRTRITHAYARQPGKPVKILIFAHGGMVDQKSAILGAEALGPMMMRDDYVPVFLVWNSDFWAAYSERLCCVSEGQKFDKVRWAWLWNIPTRLLGDVGSSLARTPEIYGMQVVRWKRSIIDKSNKYYFLDPGDPTKDCRFFPAAKSGCPSIVYPNFDPAAPDYAALLNHDHFQATTKAIDYIASTPGRVISTATFTQVGANAWSNMVRRTRIAFDNDGLENCESQPPAPGDPDKISECWKGGFSRFFDALRDTIEFKPDPNCRASQGADPQCRDRAYKLKGTDIPVQIEFYGHSMGAIVGDELLRRYPDDLPWTRIVYMAAAVSIRDFKLTAGPVIARRRIPFYSLSLHPLNETREVEAFGAVPEGSLLQWIDEMFEGPRTLDDRTLGSWKNLENTLPSWDPAILRQLTTRVFPAQPNLRRSREKAESDLYKQECADQPGQGRDDNLVCFPDKHGEFNIYSFWRPMYLTGSPEVIEPTSEFLAAFHAALPAKTP